VIGRLVVAGAIAVFALGLVAAGAERDDSRRYTRGEVVRAFAEQGYTLRNVPREMEGRTIYREGSWLMTPRSAKFLVYVTPTRWEAREVSASIARMKSPAPLPPGTERVQRFAVLDGNVYVDSIDPTLTRQEKQRVRDALASLD
jgi:hypothetical protein